MLHAAFHTMLHIRVCMSWPNEMNCPQLALNTLFPSMLKPACRLCTGPALAACYDLCARRYLVCLPAGHDCLVCCAVLCQRRMQYLSPTCSGSAQLPCSSPTQHTQPTAQQLLPSHRTCMPSQRVDAQQLAGAAEQPLHLAPQSPVIRIEGRNMGSSWLQRHVCTC